MSDGPVEQRIEFGLRIKRLRLDRQWTLAVLSERSGLAISTISKAERGLIALTYDRMASLARGLNVDMSAFFSDCGESFAAGSCSVTRKGQFERQETQNYIYDMLFPTVWNKSMRPMMGLLKARNFHEFDDYVRHPGQEFLIVLEGTVTVYFEDAESVHLDEGDSIYFDSARGHLYSSSSEDDARILVVCDTA